MIWDDSRKIKNSYSHQVINLDVTDFEDFDDFRFSLANCSYTGNPAISYFNENSDKPVIIDLLIATIEDADDYNSGDARINAARFLSKTQPSLLAEREEAILKLYDSEDIDEPGPGGCLRPLLAVVLARFHSIEGKNRIICDYKPNSYGEYHYKIALENYGDL